MKLKNYFDSVVEIALENAEIATNGMAYQEKANAFTHGIGTVLSIAGLAYLLFIAITKGNLWQIVSFGIYGSTLVILYLASTAYHWIIDSKTKKTLQMFDHSAIYLLIAGSYTPITLIALRGTWGWTLFGLVWGIAVIGILMKYFFFNKTQVISVILYIFMGLLIITATKPLLNAVPVKMLLWIVTGGLFYLLGVFFFFSPKIRYHHTIWHLFVMAGSITHFLAIFFYLA